MIKVLELARDRFGLGARARKRLPFSALFANFQKILELNNKILDMMAEMGDMLGGNYIFDRQYIQTACQRGSDLVQKLIYSLNTIVPKKYLVLNDIFRNINNEIEEELAGRLVIPETDYVMPYEFITRDFADVVGAKNANVAELTKQLVLAVPEGFAITTRAFRSFFDHNDLVNKVDAATAAWEEGRLTTEDASRDIRALIMAGSIPPKLNKAVIGALAHLQEVSGVKDLFLAVRSSARGEDSELTFAGQYLSLLNEPQANLLKCYRDVLASTYAASAMEYRRQKGFSEHEVAMAVACQRMIDAKISGVIYTMDPSSSNSEAMVITATWGLGAPIVAGEVKADRFMVSREAPYGVLGLDIVRKTEGLMPREGGGCEFRPIEEGLQTMTSLTDEQVRRIAEAGLMIEKYFKRPQDIEWAIDHDGELVILQARPLNIKSQVAQMVCDISSIVENYPVVFANKGVIAQNGIATGKVFFVNSDEDLDHFPQGAILVSKQTSPRFAKVVKKANGIITDIGSATGHMATIAREFRVPAILGTEVATRLLTPDQEITMDAEDNVVYEGTVKELCYYAFTKELFEETYEYRLLRRVLKRISPLNLLDPHDKNFVPSGCKTFHDITRFIHEKAVEALIDMNYLHHHDMDAPARRLKSDLPLDLVLIDIGGGFSEEVNSRTVPPEEIISLPMRAFLQGLGVPGAWSSAPVSVDFGSFMSSLTRTFSSTLASPRYLGQNLAVISKEYANISLRLGYHFNMIDAYLSKNINDNYAYFRFLGGVTDPARRSRRARFISEILGRNDFRVDLRGDLVVARIKKLGPELMERKVCLLGQLVAFTRQLDVLMSSDQQIEKFVQKFDQLTKNNES